MTSIGTPTIVKGFSDASIKAMTPADWRALEGGRSFFANQARRLYEEVVVLRIASITLTIGIAILLCTILGGVK